MFPAPAGAQALALSKYLGLVTQILRHALQHCDWNKTHVHKESVRREGTREQRGGDEAEEPIEWPHGRVYDHQTQFQLLRIGLVRRSVFNRLTRTRRITTIREDVRLCSGLWELALARAA